MNQSLPEHTIVLLGIGHTNAHIVRMWSMSPIPDARLVCVSNFPISTYSGMLPGVLAGDYLPEEMQMDLVKLCAAAGAELILDEVVGLNPSEQQLLFESRPSLRFDVLSIGIGSIPRIEATLSADAPVVVIKPMQTFFDRLRQQLRGIGDRKDGKGSTIAVVGGGVAGVEVSMCLPPFLRDTVESAPDVTPHPSRIVLFQKDPQLLPGVTSGLRRRVQSELSSREVDVRCGRTVVRVDGNRVILDDDSECAVDAILWATGAAAPPLLSELGLPLDENGFLVTDETLKTTADLPIFAVGDSGTIREISVPKAGVYAVRQGPVLWENMVRTIEQRKLTAFRPQRQFLKLLNRGDGKAFGEYRGVSFGGAWTWRLKDWIDTRFMRKYQQLRPMEMNSAAELPMRCHGCGSKLSSSSLFDVLETLQQRDGGVGPRQHSEDVCVGLSDADDAAVVRISDTEQLVLTTDFFPAPLEDGYLSGRIAALHAMSDVFAMGAQPTAAMALVTLPHGSSREQKERLRQLMQGCQHEFAKTSTSLVGGHTTEGPETTIGFSVIGRPWGDELCRKGSFQKSHNSGRTGPDEWEGPIAPHTEPSAPLLTQLPADRQSNRPPEPGDRLLLTKPLGTGVLLAGYRQAQCEADWFTSLVEVMLCGVQSDARRAWELGSRWMTDVSGFGLAGHLIELLRGQQVCAEVDLAVVPVLAGSVELSQAGIASSLYPANRDASVDQMDIPYELADHPRLPLLFDPQTCGGLLIVLPEPVADNLRQQSSDNVHDIGRITTPQSSHQLQLVASR